MTLREKQEKCSRTVILYYEIHTKIPTSLVIKPYRSNRFTGPASCVPPLCINNTGVQYIDLRPTLFLL